MRAVISSIVEQWQPVRDRVLWAPVWLACGIALYFALRVEPPYALGAGALVCAAGLLIAARVWARAYLYWAVILFLGALGFVLAQGRAMVAAAPMLERSIKFTRIEGRVLDITVADPDSGHARRKVTLDRLSIEKLPKEATPRMVRLSSAHIPADVRPGARVALLAQLTPPGGPVSPGGFDYRRQAYFEGIGALGFTMGHFAEIAPAPPPRSVDLWFNRLRQRIATRVSAQMPYPQSAVATALLAGERSSIPEVINADLRDSGLYHLLSISGLHVAIVCGAVFFLVRFVLALSPYIALRWPIKKIAALAAIAAGLFYSLLAGMPVPTQRSMLMTGLALLAVMLDRSAISLRVVAISAFAVLVLRPASLVGASFQLSFAAVLAMVAFYEAAGDLMLARGRRTGWFMRVFLYFGGIFATTIVVSLATLPPVLHHFGRLQIYGVIANAAAIPLTSFVVMPAGMAALALMPVHLDGVFLKLVALGVDGTLDVARWVAHLPHAANALPAIVGGWYAVAMGGFLLLCLWRGWWRLVGLVVMAGACVAGVLAPRAAVMLDGAGQALAVHDGDQTLYVWRAPPRFARRNWNALWGGTEALAGKPMRKGGTWTGGGINVACDDYACRIVRGQARLSVVRNVMALREECAWAPLVVGVNKAVSYGAARAAGCGSSSVIPYWDVRDAGGMAFSDDGAAWRAAGMTPDDVRRPWTLLSPYDGRIKKTGQ